MQYMTVMTDVFTECC